MRHQGRGGELAGPHRLRELERAQVLAEERRETLHIRRGRGEPHYAAGRRSMPMHQAALELHDAQVTCREEVTELGQERCERHEQQAMILQLTAELTAAAEALGSTVSDAHLGGTPGEHIEHGELRVAEAPCKAGARQAQRRPDGSHPQDRKSTRLNSSHVAISYAVFCLKKKK